MRGMLGNREKSSKNKFFDPKMPIGPEELGGINTGAILRLGRAATRLSLLPSAAYLLSDAIPLIPLIKKIGDSQSLDITSEDVRLYRKPIKKLSLGISFIDKLVSASAVVGVGVPLRRKLNKRIEEEFPVRANEALEKARLLVESEAAEGYVNYLSGFDNPREQFRSEMDYLSEKVGASINAARDSRVKSGSPDKEENSFGGVAGFFVKIVRSVRSFFGLFGRKNKQKEPNTNITAYDAGTGIEQVLNSMAENPDASMQKMPMISKLILDKIKLPSSDRLALLAPELLNLIFSTSIDKDETRDLIRSIKCNPHELRFVTRFKKRYGRYSIDQIKRGSEDIIPAIIDVLPTTGQGVKDAYDWLKNLLGQGKEDSSAK